MLKKWVLLALSLGTLITSCSIKSPWVRKADLPAARWFLTTTVFNGKIYSMGGMGGKPDSLTGSAAVERYDPPTNTWTKMADMPTPRGGLAAAVVGGKIVAFGGAADPALPPLATVEAYDPTSNTWTKAHDMPEARDGLATGQVNGKVYLIGGAGYNPTTFERISSSSVEEYNPADGSWTKKVDMPTARDALSACVIQGKIYTLGGLISTFAMATPPIPTAVVEAYDPATDTWTKKASMPEARWGASAVAVADKIYVFGGTNSDTGPASSSVFEYDPAQDTWTMLSAMPFIRTAMSASAINGKIYIIGGAENSFPFEPLDPGVWEYTP